MASRGTAYTSNEQPEPPGAAAAADSANEQSPLLHSSEDARLTSGSGQESLSGSLSLGHARESLEEGHAQLETPFYHAAGRERTIAYLCFLILGASVLLPWNLLIIVASYFDYRLTPRDSSGHQIQPTPFATFFVPLVYTLSNLILIIQATYSQQKRGFEKVEWKLFASIGMMALMVGLLLVSTVFSVSPAFFYVFILFISVAGAGSCASLQSSSAALTTLFDDPLFMQGVMSGQGAIAFGISIVQFLSALAIGTGKTSNHDTQDGNNTSEDEVVASTYRFLLVSLVFVFIAGLATNTLIKLPCYKHAMQRHKQLEESQQDEEPISTGDNTTTHVHTPQLQHHKSSIWQVNRKIRNLGWSIAYIYTVTIGLFPSITSLVKSTSYKGPHDSSSLLWLYLGFVVFNTSDWIGRALPGFKKLVFTNKRKLILATVARTVFIPLMLLCNIQGPSGTRVPIINSDIGYLAILAIFGISNGYLTSLLMMRTITEKNLHPDEVDVAASVALIYLTLGLCLGAVLSNLIGWIAL